MTTALQVAGIVAVSVLVVSAAAHATDTPVTGRKILVKDRTQPGTALRKVVFVSKDLAINVPAEGGVADPTLTGGVVTVFNSSGSGESQTFSLPAVNWRRIPANPTYPLRGWKYREVVFNPPTANFRIIAVVKQNVAGTAEILKVRIVDEIGSLITYTLEEPSQGSIGITTETGADRHCADFGGLVLHDESVDLGGSVYRGIFAATDSLAPGGCGGSPSGAFLDAVPAALD